MEKSILLINDMAGYGKVALSAMIPILSHMKHQVYNLPTALVSNTLDYGKFNILETTDYMKESIAVWDALGFDFDAVSTGFLVSEEQTGLVAEYCQKKRASGAKIFVDPIMGDDGRLYNGVTDKTIVYMRQMCSVAHVIVPNFTEAAFLADMYQDKQDLTEEEALQLVKKLHELGAEAVVVTSANIMGQSVTLVYQNEQMTVLPYQEIPVRFPGTGDIFSAVLLGDYLNKTELVSATRHAMHVIEKLITSNQGNADKYKGIPLEQYLEVIDDETTED